MTYKITSVVVRRDGDDYVYTGHAVTEFGTRATAIGRGVTPIEAWESLITALEAKLEVRVG